MIDHRALLDDPDHVRAALRKRGESDALVATLVAKAEHRRQSIAATEARRHDMKQASEEVKKLAKAGEHEAMQEAREALQDLKASIHQAEEVQRVAEAELEELLLTVPNLPQNLVPEGADETCNAEVRVVGEPPSFDFEPKPHWELAEDLGLVSFDQASKLSGARFAVFRGEGAKLERALAHFMLDLAAEHGYEEIAPPLLVRPETMLGAGQYPKFVGDAFETLDREYALIPTSEVPLVMLHSDEILEIAELPRRYTALTPCFRREAGAAGRDTRGLIRQHQFNKVELVTLCDPHESNAELERLTAHAEEVLKRLELSYRVVELCGGDLGFCASRTYDLEVWLPGQGAYREISSCSNCWDFQARRAKIRYRPKVEGGKKAKPALLHTLNGSGVAVGRAFLALLENGQRADGSIALPKALQPYFGKAEIVAAAAR